MSDTPPSRGRTSDFALPEGIEQVRADVEEGLRPDFEVLRVLGVGTTAFVFLAREPALQRLVAVKVLRPAIGEDETARARFEREAHCEARIAHSSVPAVYRIGRIRSGLPYLIQEFIEGRTLRDRLEAAGPVSPAEARRILADLAGALSAAHAQGVIHRDVRPDNVMLKAESEEAVLVDFGVAAVRESGRGGSPQLTRTGEILGDPHYASPELLLGHEVTAETDIYSLGILGYEILTETNPFGSTSVDQLVRGHLKHEPVDLPWNVSAVDPGLGDLLKRCLRKDPSRRPRGGDVLRELLGEEASGEELGATPGGGPESSARSLLSPFPRLAGFIAELKRRHVYQVGAVYVVSAYVLVEGAGNILEGLTAPAWIYSTIVVFVLAGFPITVALAWVFDVTTGGVTRTPPADGSPQTKSGLALKIVGLVLSVGIVALVGWLVLR